ncbi:MAG: ABC transporter ATP-binding protein/permease [Bacteroidetes bacterium]|jgi:ATP-binding cassette subfamily B multidrug efflux pump|nr:ABC transporter ATP-binding protein/permease [Bacteroidota bacterium]
MPHPPRSRSILRRLLAFLRPYRGLFVVGLLLTIAMSVVGPLRPLVMQRVLDGPIAAGDSQGLLQGGLLLLALTLLNSVFNYFQINLTSLLGQNIINDMRQQVFSHLLSLRTQYFDRMAIGALQTRAINDIQTLNTVFSTTLVTILGELLQLAFILGIMFWMSWSLTLVILCLMPLIILGTWLFKRFVEPAFRRVRHHVSELNAFTQEHITGMLVTQLFHRQQEESRRFDELNRQHRRAHLDTVLAYSIFFPVIEILTALGLALLVWYGSRSSLQGDTTLGELTAFIMFINMFFRPIRQIADQFNTLQLGIVSAERVFKVLDTTEFIENNPPTADSDRIYADPSIRFEQVHFSYLPDEPILRGIDFEVAAGTTTALVGATGSGKSTIINILMRLYEPQKGCIYVAGQDVRAYDLFALRRSMGLVLQDVFLFSGSVYENITLHNTAITRERVLQAVDEVQARAFIERLPGGLDHRVGERGVNLSTGQRQLLSFIRVLVHNPAILLLDEATSNIDTELEGILQAALQRVMQHRTSIVVAHRLSTIQHADQILAMRKGEVIERGTHQSLLQQGGYYKKLFDLQYGQPVRN